MEQRKWKKRYLRTSPAKKTLQRRGKKLHSDFISRLIFCPVCLAIYTLLTPFSSGSAALTAHISTHNLFFLPRFLILLLRIFITFVFALKFKGCCYLRGVSIHKLAMNTSKVVFEFISLVLVWVFR